MKVKISGVGLSGTVRVPGSKSYSQRHILIAGMGKTPVAIHGLSYSEDEQVALGIVKSSGAKVVYDGDSVKIEPNFKCPASVDVGESATSYRLAAGMLAARKCRTEFTGKPQLAGRPMADLIRSLEAMGAKINKKEDGFILLDAGGIKPQDIEIDQTRSSQYVSSMLLFLAFSDFTEKCLTVTGTKASEGYVNITVECLKTFGFNVQRDGDRYRIERAENAANKEIQIERDFSSAAFFIVLGLLASEEGISVEGLRKNSLQGDSAILEVLMNSCDGITLKPSNGQVAAFARKGTFSHVEIDADITPDLAPPVSVIGIFSSEGVTIKNPSRLTIKETDRKSEIIRLVESFGAVVEKGDNYIRIMRGRDTVNPGVLSFDDHRMVMSAIVAGIASGFEIEYGDIERINKSYPSFLKDLKKLGAAVNFLPIA